MEGDINDSKPEMTTDQSYPGDQSNPILRYSFCAGMPSNANGGLSFHGAAKHRNSPSRKAFCQAKAAYQPKFYEMCLCMTGSLLFSSEFENLPSQMFCPAVP